MSEPVVVFDADFLGRARTGDETYTENLLRELARLDHGVRLVAITRHPELVPPGIEPLRLDSESQSARMAWLLPRVLRRVRPAVSHFQHVIPPLFRGRSVVTVHDLSFERDPRLLGVRDRVLFRTFVPPSARRAGRVLAVSERTKRDLLEIYRIPEAKVVVIPNGVDPSFMPEGDRYDGQRYVLFVGALHARKDPLAAVEALGLVGKDLRLLIAGPDKGDAADVRRTARRLGIEDRVELLGHVPKAELAALYRGAACLVFPSRYEGFGLPALEAMASGTPVVATTAGALPETVGDAAILVEPGSAAALASGIERALAERDRLIPAGHERARQYSWADTARRTLAVYQELL
ncbi:MAG: glycosyltransferase family 4 protein [Actinomycetota bacterium]|nr:glycosyltransferase family 4 protein [Actinomycetota bacterium]